MDSRERLDEITILSPCPMDWDQMSGDDRARYCTACGKYVHNFARMTSAEAISMLDQLEPDVCGRLTRRADGRLVTADCIFAAEPEPAKTPWQFHIRSLMGIIAGFAAALGIGRLFGEDTSPTPLAQPPPLQRQLLGAIRIRPPVPTPPPSDQSPPPAKSSSPGGR